MMIELELPLPPSINDYYGRAKDGHVFIKEPGMKFRSDVAFLIAHKGVDKLEGNLIIEIDMHPPDNGAHDLDNIQKSLLDALAHGGIYGDDFQIKRIEIEMCDVVKGGKVFIRLGHGYRQKRWVRL